MKIKITGATRLVIVGLKESDIDAVWEELGMEKGAATGLCVRNIRDIGLISPRSRTGKPSDAGCLKIRCSFNR